jgi:hypothetical protein
MSLASTRSVIFFLTVCFVTSSAFAQTTTQVSGFVIDVSGANGERGRPGTSYSGSASGYGQNGRDGGDAGHPTAGQNAGHITVHLSNSVEGVLELRGQIVEPSGQARTQNVQLQIGTQGRFILKAQGGQGGAGGIGGDGQNGGRGHDGSDATRYSSGGNGGPGGSGGDGGDGTPGAISGTGGEIRVNLADKDTHLLMLLDHDVTGGAASLPGANGSGGSGGRGGSGGSSYSWTESHHDTETYTDSNGHSQTRSVTRYTHHSNPGGSSGSNGSSGRNGNGTISGGQKAADGSYQIVVKHPDGSTTTHEERYELQVTSYRSAGKDLNGIYEPNEVVTVDRIEIKNIGGMPLPQQEIAITLQNNEWVVADPVKLVVPKRLGPNETLVFDHPLTFKIKDTVISKPGGPFAQTGTIVPKAYVAGAERFMGQVAGVTQFPIRFPIRISVISGLNSLRPGETTRIFWEVENISDRDFGGDVTLSEGVRRDIISLFKRTGGDLDPRFVQFGDAQGKPLNADDGVVEKILKLKKGEKVIVEGELQVKPRAPVYQNATYETELQLGKIDSDGTRVAQIQDLSLRVAETYESNDKAEILVIANNSTTKEEIDAWKELAETLDVQIAIWDLSLEGYLDLTKPLANGHSLVEDFKGKTVVVLNNTYRDSQNTDRTAFEYLSHKQFLEACEAHGVDMLFLGRTEYDGQNLLNRLLVPTYLEKGNHYSKVSAFVKQMREFARTKKSFKHSTLKRFQLCQKIFGAISKRRCAKYA